MEVLIFAVPQHNRKDLTELEFRLKDLKAVKLPYKT
jgi:hypothetical protein